MGDEIDVRIGGLIRVRRKLLDLTQSELADALGLRFQSIHKIECGAHALTVSRLIRLSEALGVPATYFIERLTGSG